MKRSALSFFACLAAAACVSFGFLPDAMRMPVRIGVLIFYEVLLFLWAGSVYFRVTKASVRACLMSICGVLLCWLCLRFLKVLARDEQMTRCLWYAFYFPLTMIPPLFFWACCELEDMRGRAAAALKHCFFAVSGLLFAAVMTNDLHHLAFRFPDPAPWRWNTVYVHGPVYYAVFGWILFVMLAGLYVILRGSARQRPRRMPAPPVLVLGAGAALAVGYNLHLPVASRLDITLTFCFLTVVFIETCFREHLLPQNSGYFALFRETTIPIWLLGADGEPVIGSRHARPMTARERAFVRSFTQDEERRHTSSRVLPDAGERISVGAVRGGYAFWTTDMSDIFALREQLEQKNRELSEKHRLLERERNARREYYELHFRRELYSLIESEIGDKLTYIRTLADTIPVDGDPEDAARTLPKIRYLIGYCKRMSSLVLTFAQLGSVPADALSLLLRETAADAKNAGTDCAVLFSVSQDLGRGTAIAIFDLFCGAVEGSMMYRGVSLLASASGGPDGIVFTVRAETDEPGGIEENDLTPDEKTTESLRQMGARIRRSVSDGALCERVEFPAEGGGGDALSQ
ncbi:MAG: histidine kinase N-terminal 7TM domain-containing protein [Oscillospiraceae bacterium]|nr:histidine kinase N-terminal 7TM domain-containing protein [Oscillospiraceae bacterium]